jgi:branched-chain amino acid transport system permease protein
MNLAKLKKPTPYTILAAISFIVPVLFYKENFYLHLIIIIMLNIIFALGVRLTLLMGLPTLGHSAFVLIGAYASALLVMKMHISFWVALPLAGAAAVVIGVPVCYPALMRLRGGYFLLVTLAFVSLLELLCTYPEWAGVLGGYEGIMRIPFPTSLPGLPNIEFRSKMSYAYLVLVITLLVVFLMHRIDKSPFGRLIRATRQSDALSECIGISVAKIRIITFTIVCFTGGIAGSLLAHYQRHICPADFGIWPSLYMLLYVVFGGMRNVFGPILGVSILIVVPEFLRFAPMMEAIVFGLLLIVVALVLPDGLLGLRESISWLRKRDIRIPR